MDDNQRPLERSLPNSADAERAILGAILNDNGLIAQAMEMLTEQDFYVPSHRRIFYSMVNLFMVGNEINPILIAEELKKEAQLEAVGGLSFITGLSYGLMPMTDISSLARVIKGQAMLRQLIKEAARISEEAFEQKEDPSVILERAGKGVFDITLEHTTKTFGRIGVIAHKSLQKAHTIQQHGTAITGLPTGFTDVDALTLGLQRTDLIILAARPSMGKTACAVQLSTNAALHHGALVACFSLEMSEEQIGNRVLCSEARVDSLRFRAGHLNQEEWNRLSTVEQQLANAKLFIDDTPGITVLKIKAKCRRLIAEHGPLDLVVIDYLQLMGNDGSRNHYSREQEVSKLSKDLKALAKELNVPLVVLSQLSRKPEERSDHRPVLSDLRESGSLEQDADLVFFIYREDKYKNPTDHQATLTHVAEMILSKQRNGPTGVAALRFDDPSGRFENLYQDSSSQ